MNKITSILVSFVIILTITVTGGVYAFAETTTKYWEPRPNAQDSLGYVNGVENGDVVGAMADPETGGTKITYSGEGTVTGWEFPLLTEGKDYRVLSEEGNTITLELLTENKELPYINVLVDFSGTSAAPENPAGESETQGTSAAATESEQGVPGTTENSTAAETTTGAQAQTADTQNEGSTAAICAAAAVPCIAAAAIIIKKKHGK